MNIELYEMIFKKKFFHLFRNIGNESTIDAIIRTAKREVNIDLRKEDLKII